MVETMSCASVPRIVLTINHASGAGYYAMAARASIPISPSAGPPRASASWKAIPPFGRCSPPNSDKLRETGEAIPPQLAESIERTRADYERWLDVRYAAAHGHCDAIIDLAIRGRF